MTIRFLAHRRPTLLALALTLVTFVDGAPPTGFLAALLVVMPLCYLGFGAARGELRDRRTLAVQLAGLVAFCAAAALVLSLDGRAAGWLAHGLWDLVHHRSGRVVPRAWSEWCGVVDVSGALAILLLA
ncbi:hypothetical protein ACOZE3_21125 [Streptomyces cinereoruber]|uniref:hypothetical protein n=1 Tax=Streptomyces cinereoruber TaxID=67260 RepID=UPI003BF5D15D